MSALPYKCTDKNTLVFHALIGSGGGGGGGGGGSGSGIGGSGGGDSSMRNHKPFLKFFFNIFSLFFLSFFVYLSLLSPV